MASAFSITTPTNALILNDQRQGLVVFTVSNQTGRSVRVRTSVSPFPPTPISWFSIDGESERLFPPGGAETFSVRIAAASDAPPGANAFRLDAVAADRPDEDWAHGPVVGFEIPVPPPVVVPVVEERGYKETLIGVMAGGIGALVATLIVELIVVVVGFAVPAAFFGALFRPAVGPAVIVALALGGAIGAVAFLLLRAIPDPAPWRTGVAYGVIATVLLTLFQIVLAKAIPLNIFSGEIDAGIFVVIIGSLVIAALAALAGRAYGRYRAGGKL